MDRIQTDFFYIVNENHRQKKEAEEERKQEIKDNITSCIATIGIFTIMFLLYIESCMF